MTTCQGMDIDIAATESWAQIFADFNVGVVLRACIGVVPRDVGFNDGNPVCLLLLL